MGAQSAGGTIAVPRPGSWIWVTAGTVAATAATIGAVTLVTGPPGAGGAVPRPPDDHLTTTPQLVTVYFVGDTGAGPRLFAERREFGGRADVLRWSLSNVVSGNAQDSDYTSRWPSGASVAGARLRYGVLSVDLHGPVVRRPAGMAPRGRRGRPAAGGAHRPGRVGVARSGDLPPRRGAGRDGARRAHAAAGRTQPGRRVAGAGVDRVPGGDDGGDEPVHGDRAVVLAHRAVAAAGGRHRGAAGVGDRAGVLPVPGDGRRWAPTRWWCATAAHPRRATPSRSGSAETE